MALLSGAAPAASPTGAAASPAAQQKVDYKQLNSALQRLGTAGTGSMSDTLASYQGSQGQTYPQQAAGASANPLENIFSTFLANLSRPEQAVMHGIENRNEGLGGILHGVLAGLAGSNNGLRLAPNNEISPTQAIAAPMYQQRFGGNLEGAEQAVDKLNVGGTGGKVSDFVLSTLMDPLTYTGLGGGGHLAAGGLKIIGDKLGEDVAKQVATKGLRSLTPEDAQAVRNALAGSEQAAQSGLTVADRLRNVVSGNPVTGQQSFVNRLVGSEGDALTRQRGVLEQPQGIKFAGQTVLPSSAVQAAAEVSGAAPLARAAKATAPAQAVDKAVIQPFVRRAAIVRSLGQDAADYFGRRWQAASTNEAVKLNDMVRNFNNLTMQIPHADTFKEEVLGPALENGTHQELSAALRTQGETAKADLVDTADALRKHVTAERLANGSVRQEQLHDLNTWVPHVTTKEADRHLEANPSVALNLGWRPNGGGFLQGQEALRRAFPGTAKEANAALNLPGFTGKFFEEDPVKALTRYAASTSSTTAKVNLLKDLQKYDHEGNPLVVPVYDTKSRLADISSRTTETTKQLRKDVDATKREIAKAKIDEAKTPLIQKERAAAQKEVERLQGLAARTGEKMEERGAATAEKMSGRTRAARVAGFAAGQAAEHAKGTAGRRAREAGLAAKRERMEALQQFRRDVLADPEASAAEKEFARNASGLATKAYRAARKEAAQALAAPSTQKGIGKAIAKAAGAKQAITKATTAEREAIAASDRHAGDLDKLLKAELGRAQRRAATSERAAYQHSLRVGRSVGLQQKLAALESHRAGTLLAARHARDDIRSLTTAKPDGYQKVSYGVHGDFYAHPGVVKELDELEGKMRDPGALRTLGDLVNGSSQALKNLILNAPALAQARVIRDNYNNLIQMWQKGFSDTTAFQPAARITKALVLGTRKGGSRESAVARLSAEDQKIVQLMDSQGALEVGRVQSDLKHVGVAGSKSELRKQRLDPRNAESYLTNFGSHFTAASDTFSRVAMFVDQYRKLGDAARAAKATDEALFNYNDLTHAERGLKRHIPFYTYYARNAQLQLWAATHIPQKTLAITRLVQSLASSQAAGAHAVPQSSIQSGQVPLFSVGGVPVMVGLDTPQAAAFRMVQPLADIGSGLLPEKYTTQAGLSGGLGGLAQNLGGVEANTAKAAAEVASGSSLTSGAPIGKGKYAGYEHLLEANIPRASTYGGLVPNLLGQDTVDAIKQQLGIGVGKTSPTAPEEAGAVQMAQLLRLVGIPSTPVTATKSNSELKRRIREVTASADRQGIPSLAQLKRTGHSASKAK